MLEFLSDNNQLPVLVGDNFFQKIVETLKKLETKTDSDFRIKKQLLDRVESLENNHKDSMPPGYSGYNQIINLSALNNYLDGYRESIKDRKNTQKNDDRMLGQKDKEHVDFRQELLSFLSSHEGNSPFKSDFENAPTNQLVRMMKSSQLKTSGKRTPEDRKAGYHFQNKKDGLLKKANQLGLNGSTTSDAASKPISRDMRERGKQQTTNDNTKLEKPRRDTRQRRNPNLGKKPGERF